MPQTRSRLIRQEVQQGNIGASLGRVAIVDAVIEEYDRNGLEGDDVDTLKRFRGVLNNLTRSEVTKIVKQLEQARLLKAENNQNAFGAFAGQKQVTATRADLPRMAAATNLPRTLQSIQPTRGTCT